MTIHVIETQLFQLKIQQYNAKCLIVRSTKVYNFIFTIATTNFS